MKRQQVLALSPTKMATLYLVFGVLWIATTDSLVIALVDSPETVTFLQTVKGWVFVAVSGVLVYGLTYLYQQQTDASERRLQTASEKLQVLHRFIRHNIRNDLNVVLAHTQMAMEQASQTQEQTSLETVQRKTEEIVEMSDKFRVVSTLELNGEDQSVDLSSVTRDGIKAIQQKYPAVDISAELPDTAPISADYTLYHAVMELLENAIEHNQKPPEACEVSVAIAQRNGHYELEVSDNGSSIPPGEVEAFRAETESDLMHMSGIGLWMVKWVCEYHGGEIEIDTDPTDGTTVVVTFERADWSPVVDPLSETVDEVRAVGA